MRDVFIIDGIRTPIGRFAGSLASVRTDDLGAIPLRELLRRNASVDPSMIDDVILGCANQAGEDNRNVARMSSLLAGLPVSVPGCTVNRLCGSGLDAVSIASRGIKTGELSIAIAGGVESMTRAPWVMSKAESAFARDQKLEDSSIGWRFVNSKMKELYGVEAMGETAENVASRSKISREDQDAFALRSQ
jgi:3-oxoadipyl-CoA thiolase